MSLNKPLTMLCENCGQPITTVSLVLDTKMSEALRHTLAPAPSPLTSTLTWIPVSERLPELDDTCVLVVAGHEGPAVEGYYEAVDGEWLHPETNRRLFDVTHWAEIPWLPRPPASEEGEG